MNRRIVAALIAAGLALALAAGAPAQKAGGMLKVTHRDNPPSASIHEEATISTVMPFMSIYNNLVVFDPKSKQNAPDHIVPDLATEWAWNKDGTELTFKLRDGVKRHDASWYGKSTSNSRTTVPARSSSTTGAPPAGGPRSRD